MRGTCRATELPPELPRRALTHLPLPYSSVFMNHYLAIHWSSSGLCHLLAGCPGAGRSTRLGCDCFLSKVMRLKGNGEKTEGKTPAWAFQLFPGRNYSHYALLSLLNMTGAALQGENYWVDEGYGSRSHSWQSGQAENKLRGLRSQIPVLSVTLTSWEGPRG